MPHWLAWSLHCYWLGRVDSARTTWITGVVAWLLGLGLLAGGM